MTIQKFITLDMTTGKKVLKTLEASFISFDATELQGINADNLQDALKEEVVRALAAEGVLDAAIKAEVERATNAEDAIKKILGNIPEGKNVFDELTRIEGLVTGLSSQVTSHVEDAVKHITADERTKWNKVITDLSTEVSDRKAADTALQSNIDAKVAQSAYDEFVSKNTEALSGLGGRISTNESDIQALKDAIAGKNSNTKIFATMDEFNAYVAEESYAPMIGDLAFILDVKKSFIYKGEEPAITMELPAPPTGWVYFDEITSEVDLVQYLKKSEAETLYRKLANKIAEVDLDTALATKINGKAEQSDVTALGGRLDVIEGSGEGSIAKSLADAKAYTDGKVTVINDTTSALRSDVDALKVTVGNDESGLVKDVADIKEKNSQQDTAIAQTLIDAKAYTDTKVGDEAAARATLESDLKGLISTEATDREREDKKLSDRIDALEVKDAVVIKYNDGGVAVGDAVKVVSDEVVKASQVSESDEFVVGIVVKIENGKAHVAIMGKITMSDLEVGKTYYLGVDGAITPIMPTAVGSQIIILGKAFSATEFFIRIEEAIQINA